MTQWQIEPLGPWGRPVTKHRFSRYQFKASWTNTMDLLTSEIGKLGLRGVIALRIDVLRADIRLDGMLRANAKIGFPGVVVSFESKYGPLSYATDAYELWQHNVRAIALSLQALRAVDRYGVQPAARARQARVSTAISTVVTRHLPSPATAAPGPVDPRPAGRRCCGPGAASMPPCAAGASCSAHHCRECPRPRATFGLAATRRTRRRWTETDDAAFWTAVAEYRETP